MLRLIFHLSKFPHTSSPPPLGTARARLNTRPKSNEVTLMVDLMLVQLLIHV